MQRSTATFECQSDDGFSIRSCCGERNYTKRLDKLYREILAGYLSVIELCYFCIARSYYRILFLEYSKMWQVTMKYKYRDSSDAMGRFPWITQPKGLFSFEHRALSIVWCCTRLVLCL